MIITVFAKPRCGKTTLLARQAALNERFRSRYYKRISRSRFYSFLDSHPSKCSSFFLRLFYPKKFYDVVYCTDPTISFTVPIDYETLGEWKPTSGSSLFLFEEAGIGMSNRDYKSFSKAAKRFFALHGHFGCDCIVVSQSVDVDKSVRQRSQEMYLGSKLGPFTIFRRIVYSVDVNDETKDLQDMYQKNHILIHIFNLLFCWRKKNRLRLLPFGKSFLIFRPVWYKFFNSWNDPNPSYRLPDPLLSYRKENPDCGF